MVGIKSIDMIYKNGIAMQSETIYVITDGTAIYNHKRYKTVNEARMARDINYYPLELLKMAEKEPE